MSDVILRQKSVMAARNVAMFVAIGLATSFAHAVVPAPIFHLNFDGGFSDASASGLTTTVGTEVVLDPGNGPLLTGGTQLDAAHWNPNDKDPNDVLVHDQTQVTITDNTILDGMSIGNGSVASWISVDDDTEWNNLFSNVERVDVNLPSDYGRWRGTSLQTANTFGVAGAVQGWKGQQPGDANLFAGTETPTGVWTHVAMTWSWSGISGDSAEATIWVNGVPGATVDAPDPGQTGVGFGLNDPGDWFIGSQSRDPIESQWQRDLRGKLADFAFFDVALDAAQIAEIMADGVPGAVSPGQDGDFDGDLDVDGADFLKWQRDSGDAANLALWETNFGTTPRRLPLRLYRSQRAFYSWASVVY